MAKAMDMDVIDITSDSDDSVLEIPTLGDTVEIRVKSETEKRNVFPVKSPPVSNSKPSSNDQCIIAMNQLLETITPLVKKEEKEKISSKMTKKYTLIKSGNGQSFSEEVEEQLVDLINSVSAFIEANPVKIWQQLQKLLKSMTSLPLNSANTNRSFLMTASKHEPKDPIDPAEEKKRKKIIKLEKKLKALEEDINERDQQDVDLEDETNSTYLIKSRMVQCYMKYYTMLCDIKKCSKVYTGRPIHKTLPVEDVTNYPEINEEVFRYLNERIMKDSYYFPDFHDVVKVVRDVKTKHSLYINDAEIRELAKVIFEHIAQILKKRRYKDLCLVITLKEEDEDKDPADDDPELARKLEENKAKSRKEEDVIREFVEKQKELNLEPTEVPEENVDSSPEGSDSEDIESEEDDGSNKESDVEMVDVSDDD